MPKLPLRLHWAPSPPVPDDEELELLEDDELELEALELEELELLELELELDDELELLDEELELLDDELELELLEFVWVPPQAETTKNKLVSNIRFISPPGTVVFD